MASCPDGSLGGRGRRGEEGTSGVTQVTIDGVKCQGHGRCALIAPTVFDVDDLGKGHVLVSEVAETDLSDVLEARLSCPEDAITVVR